MRQVLTLTNTAYIGLVTLIVFVAPVVSLIIHRDQLIPRGEGPLDSSAQAWSEHLVFLPLLIPVLMASGLALLVVYWVTRLLGPASLPQEELSWIYSQPLPRRRALSRRVWGRALVLTAASAGVGALMGAALRPQEAATSWWAASLIFSLAGALCAVVTVSAALVRQMRHGPLRWPELERAAGRASEAAAAAVSLDLVAAVRMLAPGKARRTSKVGRTSGDRPLRGKPAQPGRRPGLLPLLLWVERTAFVRSQGAVPGTLAVLLLSIASCLSPLVGHPVLLGAVLMLCGWVLGQWVTIGVKHSQGDDHRYVLVPVSARAEVTARCVLPTLLTLLWSLLTLGVLAWARGSAVGVAAAILAGVGVGLSAVRDSVQPPVDWAAATLIPTPAGVIPIEAIAAATSGVVSALALIGLAYLVVAGVGPVLWLMAVLAFLLVRILRSLGRGARA